MPIDCEMKLIILKTEQPFLKAPQFGNSFLSFNTCIGIAVFCSEELQDLSKPRVVTSMGRTSRTLLYPPDFAELTVPLTFSPSKSLIMHKFPPSW